MGSGRVTDQDCAFDAGLTEAQRARLDADGFLAMPAMTDPADIADIRELILPILDRPDLEAVTTVRLQPGAQRPDAIREIDGASTLEPRLTETRFFRRAMAAARALFGPATRLGYDHVIVKPPFSDKATDWHQDCAYSSPLTLSARRLHWWLPLQPVDKRNGCMHFARGTHAGPRLRHVKAADSHALSARPPDPQTVTPCPLDVGGATIHLPKTLHFTGPNHSDAPRIAWIIQTGVRGGLPRFL
jgi:hypothetical protein